MMVTFIDVNWEQFAVEPICRELPIVYSVC